MTNDDHARRLGLFLLIYASILSLSVVGSIVSFVYFYGPVIRSETIPSMEDLSNIIHSPYLFHFGFVLAFVVFLLAAFVVAVATIVMDIRLGRKLRSGLEPTCRNIVVASVFNLLSALLGGILLIPFGAALGVYGFWYAFSGRKASVDLQ